MEPARPADRRRPALRHRRRLTYRDWLGYGIRTRRGPLYPFNSLKFQSVMCARLSLAAELGTDLRDALRCCPDRL